MSVEQQFQTFDLRGELFLVGSPPGIDVDPDIGVGNLHPDPGASLLLDNHILESGVVLHGLGEDGPDLEECHAVEFGFLTGKIQDGVPFFDVFVEFMPLTYHPQCDVRCTECLQVHGGEILPIDGDLQGVVNLLYVERVSGRQFEYQSLGVVFSLIRQFQYASMTSSWGMSS